MSMEDEKKKGLISKFQQEIEETKKKNAAKNLEANSKAEIAITAAPSSQDVQPTGSMAKAQLIRNYFKARKGASKQEQSFSITQTIVGKLTMEECFKLLRAAYVAPPCPAKLGDYNSWKMNTISDQVKGSKPVLQLEDNVLFMKNIHQIHSMPLGLKIGWNAWMSSLEFLGDECLVQMLCDFPNLPWLLFAKGFWAILKFDVAYTLMMRKLKIVVSVLETLKDSDAYEIVEAWKLLWDQKDIDEMKGNIDKNIDNTASKYHVLACYGVWPLDLLRCQDVRKREPDVVDRCAAAIADMMTMIAPYLTTEGFKIPKGYNWNGNDEKDQVREMKNNWRALCSFLKRTPKNTKSEIVERIKVMVDEPQEFAPRLSKTLAKVKVISTGNSLLKK